MRHIEETEKQLYSNPRGDMWHESPSLTPGNFNPGILSCLPSHKEAMALDARSHANSLDCGCFFILLNVQCAQEEFVQSQEGFCHYWHLHDNLPNSKFLFSHTLELITYFPSPLIFFFLFQVDTCCHNCTLAWLWFIEACNVWLSFPKI